MVGEVRLDVVRGVQRQHEVAGPVAVGVVGLVLRERLVPHVGRDDDGVGRAAEGEDGPLGPEHVLEGPERLACPRLGRGVSQRRQQRALRVDEGGEVGGEQRSGRVDGEVP